MRRCIHLLCLALAGLHLFAFLALAGEKKTFAVNPEKRLGQVQVLKRNGQLEVRLNKKGPWLSPESFFEQLSRQQENRANNILFLLFNITSWFNLVWVSVGFLGQMCFTGRMIVQWISSEKQQRSVIPIAFWWMSLGGAGMLLIYFIWRKDIVGVLGQSTGFLIYLRNLRLIHFEKKQGMAQNEASG